MAALAIAGAGLLFAGVWAFDTYHDASPGDVADWLQVAISVVGTIAVVWALRHSARASEIASRSLAAGRAWVLPKAFNTNLGENVNYNGLPQLGTSLVLNVEWLNRGQTPAMDVRLTFQIVLISADDLVPIVRTRPVRDVGFVMGQDETVASDFEAVVGEDYQKLLRGECAVIAHATATYRDVYDPTKTRQTVSTVKIYVNGEVVDKENRSRPRFLVATAGPQNSTC